MLTKQHNLVQRFCASKIHVYVVGSASVCSKAVVLLLLIHWLFMLSLFVEVCDWSLLYAFLSGLPLLQSSGQGINSWLLYFICPGHIYLPFEVHYIRLAVFSFFFIYMRIVIITLSH